MRTVRDPASGENVCVGEVRNKTARVRLTITG